MKTKDEIGYKERVQLLATFHEDILRWSRGEYGAEEEPALRSKINRNLVAARQAVIDAGVFATMTFSPPPAIGGPIHTNVDGFSMLFEDLWGASAIPTVADMVDQAIGVYEHLQRDSGLVRIRTVETVDIESAIERALRPAFRGTPPSSEKEVQDVIEIILNSLGIVFVREKEVAPIGPRAFRPDFTVAVSDLAIEVKLASKSHSASAIQEELNADISAYRTKWKHLLVVIYDFGVISDPHQLRRDNMKHYGVTVIVVKH
jgi:hypothetical protein